MTDDIEAFIREQKSLLTKDKQHVGQPSPRAVNGETGRKKWDKHSNKVSPAREWESPNTSFLEQMGKEHEELRKKIKEEERKDLQDYIRKLTPTAPKRLETPEYGGLGLLETDDSKQQRLQEERKKEYNDMLEKQRPAPIHRDPSVSEGAFALGQYELERRKLDEDRRREYSAILKQLPNTHSRPPPDEEHQGFPLGQYGEKRKKLDEDRKKEYNALLEKLPPPTVKPSSETHEGLQLGQYEQHRKMLEEQRKLEYSKLIEKQQSHPRQNGYKENVPPKPATPKDGLVSKMGSYEEKQRRLQEERKQELQQRLAQENLRRTGRMANGGSEYAATLPGFRDQASAEGRKRQARNKEYNDFLNEKLRKDTTKPKSTTLEDEARRRMESRAYGLPTPDEDEKFATIPSVRDHPSAELRKMEARNKEYNEFLRMKMEKEQLKPKRAPANDDSDDEGFLRYLKERPPRKGWATPTYEEILDKKRQEERNYRAPDLSFQRFLKDLYSAWYRAQLRKYDDPELYSGMRLDDPKYLRTSISDGYLNKKLDEMDDKRFRELDREYDAKKAKLKGDRHSSFGTALEAETEFSEWRDRPPQSQGAPPLSERSGPPPGPRSMAPRGKADNNSLGATLLIGQEVRASADQRKKAAYRQELEEQMKKDKLSKQREKEKDSTGSGPLNIGQRSERAAMPDPAPTQETPRVPPLNLRDERPRYPEEEFSPRQIVFDQLHGPRGQYGRLPPGGGILDGGWQGLYHRPPMMVPPPANPYLQHAGLMAAAGQPGLGPYNSPLDEAYYYYGMRDPMDPHAARGAAPPRPERHAAAAPPPPVSDRPRVRFEDDSPQQAQQAQQAPRQDATGSGFNFDTSNDRDKAKADAKKAYQEELRRQIEEQKQKKQKEKEERERYDRKLEEEIKNYDPFGRGGGGAAMRDTEGNLVTNRKQAVAMAEQQQLQQQQQQQQTPRQLLQAIDADLRQMHLENEDSLKDPYKAKTSPRLPPSVNFQDPKQWESESPSSQRPGAEDDKGHARGGNAIFGDPLTDAQKKAKVKYQEDLQRQIDERKRQQELEKERQKEEDAKLLQKIEEENRKIQAEYEDEKRKEREKQEAAQRQQEELRRIQEEKRLDEERRRREADESRQTELRRQEDERRRERERAEQADRRSDSPPIPALRGKQDSAPPRSPPIPTLRERGEKGTTPTGSRNQSAPVSRNHHRPSDIESSSIPIIRSKTEQPITGKPPASPPVPSHRTQSRQSRAHSADVLGQLAKMRQQLHSERKRVEHDLEREQNDYEVFDPRLNYKPVAPPPSKPQVDIFEVARNREPVSVRRPPDSTPINGSNVHDFNNMKKGKSESRQAFRKMFPQSPTTNDDLETQQRALLMQQEEALKHLKSPSIKSPYQHALPDMNPRDLGLLRPGSTSSAAMLDSESMFMPVDNRLLTPEYAARGRQSPRSRRRNRIDSPQSYATPMGSVTSLNPDTINQKNEERLRKLKSLAGDDISTGDPDDILERFMSKQKHDRPPSGNTLQDDSWMRPGTRVDSR